MGSLVHFLNMSQMGVHRFPENVPHSKNGGADPARVARWVSDIVANVKCHTITPAGFMRTRRHLNLDSLRDLPTLVRAV